VRFRDGRLTPNPLAPSLPSAFCEPPALGASVSFDVPAEASPADSVLSEVVATPFGVSVGPGLLTGLEVPAMPGAGGGGPPPSLAGGRCSSACSTGLHDTVTTLLGERVGASL
jgi:hypothetical protein